MMQLKRAYDPPARGDGRRILVERLWPRGVKKEEYARRNFFDVWLPEVSPSRALVSYAQAKPWTDKRWATFTRRYFGEMRRTEAQRVIALLAALSKGSNFSIGCYCENPQRCHRSLLGTLLRSQGGTLLKGPMR